MSCRVSALEAIQLTSKSVFKQHDIILSKEQSVISKITKLFQNKKNIATKQYFRGYKIDLYFPEDKLAIKVDEKVHTDRD